MFENGNPFQAAHYCPTHTQGRSATVGSVFVNGICTPPCISVERVSAIDRDKLCMRDC